MSAFVELKKGIEHWCYDFTLQKKRYRGSLGPVAKLSKRQAEDEIVKIRAEILNGEYEAAKKPFQMTPAQVLAEYLDFMKLHRPKTYKSYRYGRKALTAYFSKLKQVTPLDIVKYQKLRLSQGVCGITVNRELDYCSAAYNRAVQKGLVKENPFKGYDKFEEFPRTRYLSEAEMARLLDNLDGVFKDIVLTAILTGLRRGNILCLHADQIDFANQCITIPASQSKNKQALTIPLPDALVPVFKARIAASRNGYVFENRNTGKPYTCIKKPFRAALEAAGIKDFRFHDLRHTFATLALLGSRDLRTVQELLGHQSIRMTQKYTHVMSQQKQDVSAIVGDFVNKALAGNPPAANL